MTNQDIVLCNLLDCGTADLELLEDINYDLDGIIDELKQEFGTFNINLIFESVFICGMSDLSERLAMEKDEIAEEISEKIEEAREMNDFDGVDELEKDLEMLLSGEITPEEDVSWFLNYIDTHVSLKNYRFYARYMLEDIEEIEGLMGWNFEPYE